MRRSTRGNQGLLRGNGNVTIFSLNKDQRWPVWQFTILWLLPWFFCRCLFVLVFYSGDNRAVSRPGERSLPVCGKFGKKQPISSATLTAPRFTVLAMLWGLCGGRISAVGVACPKHACVYSTPVTAGSLFKSSFAGNSTVDPRRQ